MKHNTLQHKRSVTRPSVGAAGKIFLGTALMLSPLADIGFRASAQQMEPDSAAAPVEAENGYKSHANPFEANDTIRRVAGVIMLSAPQDRIRAMFKMLNVSSPNGLKCVERKGRHPRTAAEAMRKGGNISELSNVVLAVINAMNTMGANMGAEAAVGRFREDDKAYMLIRIKSGLMPVPIDLEAGSPGCIKKTGNYVVMLRLRPDEAAAFYHREYGDYYRDSGRDIDAVDAYERSLKLCGSDPYVHFSLGLLYEKAGDAKTAKVHFNAADSLAPGTYHKEQSENPK